jgi:signal transduction histidine kinase
MFLIYRLKSVVEVLAMWHNDLNEFNVHITKNQKEKKKCNKQNDNLDINKDEASFLNLVDLKDYEDVFYDDLQKNLLGPHAYFSRRILLERLNVVVSIILNFARIALSDLSPQYTTWLAFFDIVQLSTRPFDAPRWTTFPIISLSLGSSIIYAIRSRSEIPELILTFFSLASFGHLLNLLTYTTLRKYSLLDAMASNLKKAIEVKNVLIRNASHEYRSPLLAINGAVEMIANNVGEGQHLSEVQLENLETVRHCSDMLLHIVEDVLHFSKHGNSKPSGFLPKDNGIFQLGRCIKHVMAVIDSYSNRIDVSIKLLMDDSLKKLNCIGDVVHLQQVLINILTNAAKASLPGSVVVLGVREVMEQEDRSMELTNEEIDMYTDNDKKLEYRTSSKLPSIDPNKQTLIEFRISDQGVGIPKSKRLELFQPFSTLNSYATDTGEAHSTGLGLTMIKKMVRNMGGVIKLVSDTSSDEHGTIFKVIIPMNLAPTSTQQDVETVTRPLYRLDDDISHNDADIKNQNKQLPTCRVIVADDNLINLRILCKLLESCKTESIQIDVIGTARDGRELIDNIREIKHRGIDSECPHVILCDYHMPDMDGLQAVEHIRSILENNVKYILLTADTIVTTSEHNAVDLVLHKPIEGKVLRQRVLQLYKSVLQDKL